MEEFFKDQELIPAELKADKDEERKEQTHKILGRQDCILTRAWAMQKNGSSLKQTATTITVR